MLYLGGSIHALRKTDNPLPAVFDRAFADASRIAFEVEDDEATVKRVAKSGEYPRNDSLKNHIDPRSYAYLRSIFGLLGVPEAKFSRYRPWLLTVMLWSPSLHGLSHDLGVEEQITRRARAARKPTSGLVSMEEHLNVFTGLSDRQSEAVLLMTFIPGEKESYPAMVKAWRSGDVDTLWRRSRKAFAEYPAFGERLLEARNRRWMPKIESYFRSGERYFVVVGAAHLGGPEGLLALLKQRGYQAEQL
jgi:uncharacterized protein YbaP (TraB family)